MAEIINGMIKIVQGATGGIVTKKDWEFRMLLESNEQDYKYVDVILEDGKY